jgi:RimJ/RimL family protein N-acetyltransferase
MHRASVPVLETARLRLRAPTLDDLPAWTAIFADWPGESMDAEQAWTEFSYYTAGWMLHGHGLWSVEVKDGTLAGFVHLGIEWEDDEPELGWMFLPEARRQGYATEAATAAREHALGLLGAGAFVSYVNPANTPSSRLAARLGAARDANTETAISDESQVWRHGGRA